MDTNPHSDLSRISLESLGEWQRIKDTYTQVATSQLESRLKGLSAKEKEAVQLHLKQVGEQRGLSTTY
jgi:hypothetical protein